MTVYNVNGLDGQTVSFDPDSDTLYFSGNNASAVSTAETGGNLQVATAFATITLLATQLGAVTPANAVFTDGSRWAVGELTVNDTADGGGDSIDFTSDPLLVDAWQRNNLVHGLGGADTIDLTAGHGDNRIFGGGGADTIAAGNGDNTIYGGAAGTDSTDGADAIAVGGGSNTVYGNAGGDSLSFSAATQAGETLTFYGGLGADTLSSAAAAGSLFIDGGPGADALILTGATGSATVYGGNDGDTVNAGGGASAMTIYGGEGETDTDDGADTITTGGGDLRLFANAGADSIVLNTSSGKSAAVYAGAGNDTVTSGAAGGAYFIAAGPGSDSVNLTGHTGNSTIYGGSGAIDSADGADTIVASAGGSAVIYGNAGADAITVLPGAGLSALVYAGLGADTVSAAPGAATAALTLYGNSDADIFNLSFAASPAAVTLGDFGTGSDEINLTLSGGTATGLTATRGASGLTISNGASESILLSGYSGRLDEDNLILSDGSRLIDNRLAAAATLEGDSGSDQIIAGSNGDTLEAGGGGNDLLIGGAGGDVFRIDAAAFTDGDSIAGGGGSNVLNLTAAGANVTDLYFTHVSGIQTVELDNADFAASPITLGTLAGSAGIAAVDASALSSNGATVNALSLTRALTFSGGAGDDSVTGSTSGDTLGGGGGDDSFQGGIGGDILTGGAGDDVFLYNSGTALIPFEAADIIADFDPDGADRLRFDDGAGSYNLGNIDNAITGAIISAVAPAGAAGTEVVILNTVGIATASIASQLNAINSLVNPGKGVLDLFYDSSKGHAVLYYDSNGGTSGGHTLLADLTGITALADMNDFDLSDFSFV